MGKKKDKRKNKAGLKIIKSKVIDLNLRMGEKKLSEKKFSFGSSGTRKFCYTYFYIQWR